MNTDFLEIRRQLIAPAVKFLIAQLTIRIDESGCLGSALHLSHHQLMQAKVRGKFCAGVIPFNADLLLLARGEYWKLRNSLLRVGNDAFEQRREMCRHTSNCGRFKKVGAVLETSHDAGRPVIQFETQVELRNSGIDFRSSQRCTPLFVSFRKRWFQRQ